MRRCDYCGGKLGLIIHRIWKWRFCKLACKEAYEYRPGARKPSVDDDSLAFLSGSVP
jgi:hypothetical protein